MIALAFSRGSFFRTDAAASASLAVAHYLAPIAMPRASGRGRGTKEFSVAGFDIEKGG
jgi:hypothetical protein